jgi:HTH-type transcriptional regulator/antitoxin HigA
MDQIRGNSCSIRKNKRVNDANAIGLKSRGSEILNRKRKLTIDMIRKLSATPGIPAEVLLQEY